MTKRKGPQARHVGGYEAVDNAHEGLIPDAARRIASWQGSTKSNIYTIAKRELHALLKIYSTDPTYTRARLFKDK